LFEEDVKEEVFFLNLLSPLPSHIPFLLPDLRQEEKNNRCFFLLPLPFFILEIGDLERDIVI